MSKSMASILFGYIQKCGPIQKQAYTHMNKLDVYIYIYIYIYILVNDEGLPGFIINISFIKDTTGLKKQV